MFPRQDITPSPKLPADYAKCKDKIEDTVIQCLLEHCSKKYKISLSKDTKEPFCDELFFVFDFVYREYKLPVIVQRNGDKIIYMGRFREQNDFNDPVFREYLNAAINPNTGFIPIAITEDNSGYAAVRHDIDADDNDMVINQIRFNDALLNLKYFLDNLPKNFAQNP